MDSEYREFLGALKEVCGFDERARAFDVAEAHFARWRKRAQEAYLAKTRNIGKGR